MRSMHAYYACVLCMRSMHAYYACVLCMRIMHAYYACVACMRICHVCIQASINDVILAGVHTSLRNIDDNGFNDARDRARARALMEGWRKLRPQILSVLENHHLEWPQILSILRADDQRPITGTAQAGL